VQLGRATKHAAEFTAMSAAEHSTELAAMRATEHAAMRTPEFTAMGATVLAAIFAFARANHAAFDTAHQVKDLKHFTTSLTLLNNPRRRDAGPQRTLPTRVQPTGPKNTFNPTIAA
jgi:hypothetical protein